MQHSGDYNDNDIKEAYQQKSKNTRVICVRQRAKQKKHTHTSRTIFRSWLLNSILLASFVFLYSWCDRRFGTIYWMQFVNLFWLHSNYELTGFIFCVVIVSFWFRNHYLCNMCISTWYSPTKNVSFFFFTFLAVAE